MKNSRVLFYRLELGYRTHLRLSTVLSPLRCKNHLIAWLRRFVVCKYCDTDFIDVIFLTFPWTIKMKCCYVFLGYVGYMLCDQILMLTFYFNLVDITQIVKLWNISQKPYLNSWLQNWSWKFLMMFWLWWVVWHTFIINIYIYNGLW